LELRAGGVTLPILVLGYTPAWQASQAATAQVTLTVYDVETAVQMNELIPSGGRLAVHVKVNTGMNRLGVGPAEAPALLGALHDLPNLYVEGVFTHFATSDELDRSFAELQFSRFSALLARLEAAGLRPPLAHAANSAALLTMPQTHLDLVRSGIALYGLAPDMEQCPLPPGFAPALTWKAIVTRAGSLEPGDSVSYGREFVAARPMRVAAIPVGYADGFPRKPYTWGSVLLRGLPAPILGRVCMDQTVVDVTRIEAVTGPLRQGEEVVLIGQQGDACVSAEEVSARIRTNNYDVVSRILSRVPRVLV
jgi:alanine racemase